MIKCIPSLCEEECVGGREGGLLMDLVAILSILVLCFSEFLRYLLLDKNGIQLRTLIYCFPFSFFCLCKCCARYKFLKSTESFSRFFLY